MSKPLLKLDVRISSSFSSVTAVLNSPGNAGRPVFIKAKHLSTLRVLQHAQEEEINNNIVHLFHI